jgi:hypothetical protein
LFVWLRSIEDELQPNDVTSILAQVDLVRLPTKRKCGLLLYYLPIASVIWINCHSNAISVAYLTMLPEFQLRVYGRSQVKEYRRLQRVRLTTNGSIGKPALTVSIWSISQFPIAGGLPVIVCPELIDEG